MKEIIDFLKKHEVEIAEVLHTPLPVFGMISAEDYIKCSTNKEDAENYVLGCFRRIYE